MEKTVVVLAANNLSSSECGGHGITFEVTQAGRGAKSSASKTINKTIWSCCVEAVLEYCRIVFDLFPDQCQVCVAAVDEAKCQPVNSWRDEDQEVVKVQNGFQKFGVPSFLPPQGATLGRGHLNPCLQGLQYAVRCLAQLTATQFAVTSCPGMAPPPNQGRIIFMCSLKKVQYVLGAAVARKVDHNCPPFNSEADVREMEKAILSMVKAENQDIKSKHDIARLPIDQCQLTLINVYSPSSSLQGEIKDAPIMQLSSHVSSVVYSFPAKLILEKSLHLVKVHFNLKSTIVTGIPMKEEQSGGNSANYDVELIHLAEAHRDILRASYGLGVVSGSRKDSSPKDVVLKWSTPKSTSLELQACTSAYRVTPSDVTSRPTICLINFVLSGKAVLLEQPRKNAIKIISHLLTSHAGVIFLHCIPSTRPHLDDPPSISEGWGGRVTDYRISDFSELVRENTLVPVPVDRTKIPKIYPQQNAMSKLERATRHWPMVFADTLIYTLTQEMDCLPAVMKQESMSDPQLDQCRQVITRLYEKEKANEPLSLPTGGRNKGVKRDEQYRSLWTELEEFAHTYSSNSDRHRHLLEFLLQVTSRCPSMQLPRKTPPLKTENGSSAGNEVYSSRTDKEMHAKDRSARVVNGSDYKWNLRPQEGQRSHPMMGRASPKLAKPVGSLLSIWSSRKQLAADSCHQEFAGRSYSETKTELYKNLRTSNVVPLLDHD